ncbi:MAG: hypothetical protein P0S96_05185 [Simkaniaceae bacterium]|nr:hypothetical protein [Candidatus Sacchlamyda saccharinae]
MKSSIFIIANTFCILSGFLYAQEGHEEELHYEWFQEDQVAVAEDGIYAESNKGMFKLNIVEYDRVNKRYKVRCRCLEDPHLDAAEALAVPCDYVSQ